jgi:phosphopantothenoylcysteine decarboxylase/phosphopantothenate--cysteine ligase
VLTEDAQRFVGALTFSALASEPARTSLFEGPDPIPHTQLGRRADLVVVAPATAKVIGKYTHGISDDLLTATLLATKAPVLLAPAMHTEMWEHAAVQENLVVLRERGVHVIAPVSGRLAGGDVGEGASPPVDIVAAAGAVLSPNDLAGVRVLVTAGGTVSRSARCGSSPTARRASRAARSPKAARRGADVTLVTTIGRPAPQGRDRVGADGGRDAGGGDRSAPPPT